MVAQMHARLHSTAVSSRHGQWLRGHRCGELRHCTVTCSSSGCEASTSGRSHKPVIILVNPQLPENIGAAARAMKNFGLSDLRLVAPTCGWPSGAAQATSVGAFDLLDSAQLYSSLEKAVADLEFVFAATARQRHIRKATVTSRELAAALPGDIERLGFVFGRESSGLTNEEVALANAIVCVDSDPAFPVLNLAQAVCVVCYELRQAGMHQHGSSTHATSSSSPASIDQQQQQQHLPQPGLERGQALATVGDLDNFLSRLYVDLEQATFFEDDNKRASVQVNIRNLFTRVDRLSKGEVAMLHGMVAKLADRGRGRQQRQQQHN